MSQSENNMSGSEVQQQQQQSLQSSMGDEELRNSSILTNTRSSGSLYSSKTMLSSNEGTVIHNKTMADDSSPLASIPENQTASSSRSNLDEILIDDSYSFSPSFKNFPASSSRSCYEEIQQEFVNDEFKKNLPMFYDDNKILRCQSRFDNDFTYDEKYLIVLPKSPFTISFLNYLHEQDEHGSVNFSLSSIRTKYFLPKAIQMLIQIANT
ncbi:hypothetical protein HUG17_7382 [Dermatophagoides farinae]|uniref:Uncharacterized protein n=1 Tax=Dermatophagoides farinae TaxID=6954 RepID=A0A9D4SD21_DERFA|nr:hypothetical protein HUG17_7382 [Dermatophagoides farinae]